MDFLIGGLFGAFLIAVSTLGGRSLDRAKRRAAEAARRGPCNFYGDF
jgi:hypothetical protein